MIHEYAYYEIEYKYVSMREIRVWNKTIGWNIMCFLRFLRIVYIGLFLTHKAGTHYP